MSGGTGRRLMFYSHDGVGIGHLQRQLRLAAAYRRRHADAGVLVVTGSHAAGALRFPSGVDYLKLPSIRMLDRYRTWEPRDFDSSIETVTRLRSDLIRDAVRQFKPHLLIADFMPAGPYGELLAALDELAGQGGIAVAGFRDIVGDPVFVRELWSATGVYEALRERYAAVCVYGAREVVDFSPTYGLQGELAQRIHYVGYLAPTQTDGRPRSLGRPLIVGTAGGGADGGPLLRTFVRAAAQLRPRLGGSWLAVTGPLLDDREHEELCTLAAGAGVAVERSLHRLGDLIASADVAVTMAGYNTTCELLSCTTPAVVVPREGPSQEQRLRGRELESWGRALVLEPEGLEATVLGAAITRALGGPRASPAPVPVNGLGAAVDLFDALAGDREYLHVR